MSICMKTHAVCLLAMLLASGVCGQKTTTYLQERYIIVPEVVKGAYERLPPKVVHRSQRLEPAKGYSFYSSQGITWVLPSSAVKGRSIRIESGKPKPQHADLTFRYCSCEGGSNLQGSDCSLELNEENNFGCTGHCNTSGRLVPCASIDYHFNFRDQAEND